MLASEAREVLSLALSEATDPLLEDLVLLDVVAGGGAIVVTLAAPSTDDAVRAALERVRPRLRSELASQLQRRRVPELSLVLVPMPEVSR